MGIWNSRHHVCFECGEPIKSSYSVLYMHHVLAKKPSAHQYSDYSRFRHCRWNIVLLHWPCHTAADGDNAPRVKAYKDVLLLLHEEGVLDNLSPNLDHYEVKIR
jgi:5-methylcytosine-specific restriction endonuclease McrA